MEAVAVFESGHETDTSLLVGGVYIAEYTDKKTGSLSFNQGDGGAPRITGTPSARAGAHPCAKKGGNFLKKY